MRSTLARRIVRIATAGTVAATASFVLIAAPTSADAGAHTLKAHTLKAHTLKAHTLKAHTLKAHTLKAHTLKAHTLG